MIYPILVLIIILIIFLLFISNNTSTDSSMRNNIKNIINNKLFGERLDSNVLDVIRKINKIKNKNACDYNNLGMLYSCHLGNHIKSHDYYIKALDNMHNKMEENDANTAIYRMENIINRKVCNRGRDLYVFPAHLRQKILPIMNLTQNAIYKKIIKKSLKKKTTKKRNVDIELKRKKVWKSDTQNVHDSVVLNDLKSQFKYIKDQNNVTGCSRYTFDQICNFLINYPNTHNKSKDIIKVLNVIRNNGKVINLDVCEKAYLMEIWRRIQTPVNNAGRKSLELSLICSLQDCVEKGSVVCPTGRNTRLMASLAHLDRDSKSKGIGILKSKESLRNEILEFSAKIVQKHIGSGSSTPKYIIEHYNEGKSTEKVKDLEEKIKTEILNLRGEFIGRGLDDKKIDQILSECMAVI